MSKRPDEMTYTPCSVCHGALFFNAPHPGTSTPCPCVQGSMPGWVPTGVTLHQINRLADMERALRGDPGLPAKRQCEILEWIRVKLVDALKKDGD